jgi:hypothetical protein
LLELTNITAHVYCDGRGGDVIKTFRTKCFIPQKSLFLSAVMAKSKLPTVKMSTFELWTSNWM